MLSWPGDRNAGPVESDAFWWPNTKPRRPSPYLVTCVPTSSARSVRRRSYWAIRWSPLKTLTVRRSSSKRRAMKNIWRVSSGWKNSLLRLEVWPTWASVRHSAPSRVDPCAAVARQQVEVGVAAEVGTEAEAEAQVVGSVRFLDGLHAEHPLAGFLEEAIVHVLEVAPCRTAGACRGPAWPGRSARRVGFPSSRQRIRGSRAPSARSGFRPRAAGRAGPGCAARRAGWRIRRAESPARRAGCAGAGRLLSRQSGMVLGGWSKSPAENSPSSGRIRMLHGPQRRQRAAHVLLGQDVQHLAGHADQARSGPRASSAACRG